MKIELLPEFAKPYKTKGYDVRLVRGHYQLFKISSKRVPGKSYPKLVQTYVGTITEDKGLILRKINVDNVSVMVEYGFSHFILLRYKRDLLRCFFNNSGSIQTVYMGIVLFMYGHIQQRFIDMSYLKTLIKPCPEITGSNACKRIARVSTKIDSLLKRDIPDAADRDYVITALKDIKADISQTKPSVTYSDELKSIFNQYRIKYE